MKEYKKKALDSVSIGALEGSFRVGRQCFRVLSEQLEGVRVFERDLSVYKSADKECLSDCVTPHTNFIK